MTIAAVVPAIKFAGSSGAGTSGPFSLVKSGTPINFSSNSHIKVYRYDTTSDTAPVLLVENTDYTLTGGPDAGSLTLTSPQTPLLTAERLLVYREQPTTQALNLTNGSNFSGPALEARFDRVVEMVQELGEKVGRAVKATTFGVDAIPDFNLAAALGKIAYLTGTEANPVWAYGTFEATDVSAVADALDEIAIVAADLTGADTIGAVAAIAAEIETIADALNGSGLAGALPVIATGSVTERTLADRFAEHINVKDHGATGDGTTDDTTAIQAAITAANATTHKRLYFPAGTYKYTAQLLWHDGAVWFGDGPEKSVLKLDSTAGNIVAIRTNTTSNVANAKAVTSVTSSSTTATVTTTAAHGYTTGDLVNIVGATQIEYTGSFEITVTGATTFTYTFRGSATSPATGTITCTPRAYMQSSLTLQGLHFQGYNAVLTVTPGATHSGMLRAFSIENLVIEGCKFSDHKHILLAMGGCKNVRVLNNEFTTFGRLPANWNDGTLPAFDGGAAWWMAANPIDNSPSQDAVFEGNYVHDGDGAVYMMGQNVRVIGNTMRGMAEGPYNRRLDVGAESNDSERFVFAHNTVEDVVSVWVQASGIELGSKSAIVAYNTFRNCEGPAIDISDVCEDVLVIGNQCIDCAYFTGTTPDGSSTITQAGSIWVRSTSYSTNVPSGIKIIGNTIRSAAGNYGIRIYETNGDTFDNLLITGNDLLGSASSSVNYLTYDSADFGSDISIFGNQGADDYVPVSSVWTPTIAATSGTLGAAAVAGTAKYNRVGNMVFYSLAITVTDNGTASDGVTFTLPESPAYGGNGYGQNQTNGLGLTIYFTTAGLATIRKYDSTHPVTGVPQTIRVSGFYLLG